MMELEIAFGHRQQNGMMEQDRVSQASSVVTVSSTRDKTDKKLQSFCKRSRSVQRDPNCAVVIRGWLHKKDSTGLRLWKRRWFVLSNYCLFYYKDSREECVLGSLPLPSYKIFLCSPGECKNRKYAFKVVHQGMRSYLLSADTQEDMLGWVRALRQSACMENDDLISRRCSSYHDFSQLGGSTESVNPLHVYKIQNKPCLTAGGVDMGGERGRHRPSHSYDTRTRSLSLDRTGEDHFRCHGSGPLTPRCQYESQSHSPVGRVDLRPQEIQSDQLPPLPPSRITHNPSGPLHHSTASVCVFPSSMCEKEIHTLSALQGDTDMVLTCLCGCDKVLQTFSIEMDLLQHDKDHAEFALDMSRIELGKGQLNEQHISQKALLQEELVTIRARMCDISREMERVWLDYKRMESELCVFRSHLQHICHFGLPQERSLAQKQIWMMDDILSGLKPNRRRFKALIALHTPTMFPLLHNSSLHSKESVHYWGEELQPPARPPLPLELENTNKSSKLRSEWAEPYYTMLYNADTINTDSITHTNTHPAESKSVCLGEESGHFIQMAPSCNQKKTHTKRSRSPDYQMNMADKPRPFTESESESSPLCLMHIMRAELPSVLTAQRVRVEESNPEEDKLHTQSHKHEEQSDNDNLDVRVMKRDSDLNMMSEQRHAKLKRADRIRERGLKSALRRSDSAHPLKFIDTEGSGQKSTHSLRTDGVRFHGNTWMTESDVPETPPTFSDIKPSSTNHVSTLTINNIASEETDERVNCSSLTSQKAEWFLSTNHWQEFIPLNIQEEELSPSTQNSDTSTNQNSEQSTNQTHLGGNLNMTTLLVAMETLNKTTPKLSAALSHQPTGTSPDNHKELQSDRSGPELCVYEEILHKAPESATEDNGSVIGEANVQQTHLSTNHNSSPPLSANQHAPLDFGGGGNGTTEEEVAQEISGNSTQQMYGCWSKNSVTSPSDSFNKPRVTVLRTSL
ncbi:uncharacterized protein si:ch211-234p6.5 isoform X2 [Hemibagrus wyckioides]|uniref:uncharacterized protein si:ch211-234p6.5 isoform X2 n=1 Tax=Hemibagrus wyckioides TaxID=337641 RepID=UPI00266BE47A|nr:uncharacterized protein si:ch211-234p6.5 isoform X2 [Hemibagrus wyckioides]